MNPWEWLMSASMCKFVLLSAAAGIGVSMIALVGGRLLRRHSATARYVVLFVGVLGMLASPVLVAIGPACGGWMETSVTETVRIPAEKLTDAMASKTTEPARRPALRTRASSNRSGRRSSASRSSASGASASQQA